MATKEILEFVSASLLTVISDAPMTPRELRELFNVGKSYRDQVRYGHTEALRGLHKQGLIRKQTTQTRRVYYSVLSSTRLIEDTPAKKYVPKPTLVAKIRGAVNEYYLDLDKREHGGVAMDRAFNKIQQILGMTWVRGQQLAEKEGDTRGA